MKYKEKLKDTKDYIVIPIPNEIEKISELFNQEKTIKIEINGKTFYTTYSREIAIGRINSIHGFENVDAVLMIPIKNLKEENIDNIESGKIGVYKSVLQLKDLIVIIPENRKIDFQKEDVQRINTNNTVQTTQNFLGEDYLTDSDESANYEIFKGKTDMSQDEQAKKKEAIMNCLFENMTSINDKCEILVDEHIYDLPKEDRLKLKNRPKRDEIYTEKLQLIVDNIGKYLNDKDKSSVKIDNYYKELMLEYLRVVPKSKALYYEEEHTHIHLKIKEKNRVIKEKISIKPKLPLNSETIAKRYTRPNENIAYKMMILAKLVNRFAHLLSDTNQNEELKEQLYKIKLKLVEKIIDLSNIDTNIKIYKMIDKRKKNDKIENLMAIVVVIPGYSMISLHLKNAQPSLKHKFDNLIFFQIKLMQHQILYYQE